VISSGPFSKDDQVMFVPFNFITGLICGDEVMGDLKV